MGDKDKNIGKMSFEELLNEMLNSITKKLKFYEDEVSYLIEHKIDDENKNILIKITLLPKTPSFYLKKECLISIDTKHSEDEYIKSKIDIDSKLYILFDGGEGKREVIIRGLFLPRKTQPAYYTNSLVKAKAIVSTALNSLLIEVNEDWFKTNFSNKDIEEIYYIQLINEKYNKFASTLSEEEKKVFYSIFGEGYSVSHTFKREYDELSALGGKKLYYWFCSVIGSPNFKEALKNFSEIIRSSLCLLKI